MSFGIRWIDSVICITERRLKCKMDRKPHSGISSKLLHSQRDEILFNAGGKVQVETSRLGNGGSSATSKDSSMSELISAMGRLTIGSTTTARSGTGETLTTNGLALGFHDLTSSYQTILRLTQDGSGYTSMFIDVQAKLNNSPGSSTQMTVRVRMEDPDGGDSQFTSGNTSGVDQYANFIGQTRSTLLTTNPNTTNGLATAYTPSSTAVGSNNTA